MRGQSAFEFLTLLGLGTLLLTILLGLAAQATTQSLDEQRREQMITLATSIQEQLVTTVSVQEGFEQELTIPESLGRFNYEITNDENTITLTGGGQEHTIRTPPLTGTLHKGTNTIRNQDARVLIT